MQENGACTYTCAFEAEQAALAQYLSYGNSAGTYTAVQPTESGACVCKAGNTLLVGNHLGQGVVDLGTQTITMGAYPWKAAGPSSVSIDGTYCAQYTLGLDLSTGSACPAALNQGLGAKTAGSYVCTSNGTPISGSAEKGGVWLTDSAASKHACFATGLSDCACTYAGEVAAAGGSWETAAPQNTAQTAVDATADATADALTAVLTLTLTLGSDIGGTSTQWVTVQPTTTVSAAIGPWTSTAYVYMTNGPTPTQTAGDGSSTLPWWSTEGHKSTPVGWPASLVTDNGASPGSTGVLASLVMLAALVLRIF